VAGTVPLSRGGLCGPGAYRYEAESLVALLQRELCVFSESGLPDRSTGFEGSRDSLVSFGERDQNGKFNFH
jgi:hypothetical protein